MRSMLSNSSLPKSFWGYALQNSVYLINRVPSKSIPKTPFKLWTGYKPSLKGGFFYNPKDNKMFVSTNARFLENDHIRNHKSNNKVVLEELDTNEIGDLIKDQNDEIIVDQPIIISETT